MLVHLGVLACGGVIGEGFGERVAGLVLMHEVEDR